MKDDIVKRLRATETVGSPLMPWHVTPAEAADEIERLNKLVTTWIICAERLVETQEGEPYDKALEFYLDCQRIARETC